MIECVGDEVIHEYLGLCFLPSCRACSALSKERSCMWMAPILAHASPRRREKRVKRVRRVRWEGEEGG